MFTIPVFVRKQLNIIFSTNLVFITTDRIKNDSDESAAKLRF